MMKQPFIDESIQRVLLKRFGLAAGTYLLVFSLIWLAVFTGYYRASLISAGVSTGLALVSQAALAVVFLRGWNARFKDPGLTEVQVLLALVWQTWSVAHLDQARGTFLAIYVLILLFGLFHLRPAVFRRCAGFALGGFLCVNLAEFMMGDWIGLSRAALQICTLFIVLVWLCLYAGFVQDSRQRMRQRRVSLQAHQDTLRGMMSQLEELASTDELTNLYNRRHFMRIAGKSLASLDAIDTEGLALIDLDHFKRVNDTHGHAMGDRVLQAFAMTASECLRDSDLLARYGGEEFVLLIPRATREQLVDCCERIRYAFSLAKGYDTDVGELSLSIGMALLKRGDDLDKALHMADQALYRAKRNGRNRCVGVWEFDDA